MTDCQNLCTAAKCQELEDRINGLKNELLSLRESFNRHLSEPVPGAHEINSSVNVSTTLNDNNLRVQVEVENIGVNSDSVNLPYCTIDECDRIERKIDGHIGLPVPGAHEIDSSVNVSLSFIEEQLRVQVEVEDIGVNSDTIALPGAADVDLSGYCTVEECDRIERKIDGHISLPVPEAHEIDSSVNVSLELLGETLRVQVEVEAIGVNSDTVSLDPLTSTIFITEEIREEVNCEELENLVRNGFNDVDNSLNNLSQELNTLGNSVNNLSNDVSNISSGVQTIENFVTIDISGTIETGQCSDILKDGNGVPILDGEGNEQIIDPYYEVAASDPYSEQGLQGLNQAVTLLDKKLTAIHQDICNSQIEAKAEIPLEQFLPAACREDLPRREDYTSDDAWYAAVQTVLNDGTITRIFNSATRLLGVSPSGGGSLAIMAAETTVLQYLLEANFQQTQANYFDICQRVATLEAQDVVSLVASEKDLKRISGKQLVLHLVQPSDYPTRTSNSVWQLQIPAAKDTYDWNTDFETLVKCNGNVYARLFFDGGYAPVSGFFKDETKANAFFDRVLTLTNAVERNRAIHLYSNPNVNITQRVLRPYRAFITELNANGQAVCLAKYAPPIPYDPQGYTPTCD